MYKRDWPTSGSVSFGKDERNWGKLQTNPSERTLIGPPTRLRMPCCLIRTAKFPSLVPDPKSTPTQVGREVVGTGHASRGTGPFTTVILPTRPAGSAETRLANSATVNGRLPDRSE